MRRLESLSIETLAELEMRYRVDVNTLDGKLSFEKESVADAVAVAKGATDSLGVTITDTADGTTYRPEDFDRLLRKV
jgi:hypothetical protein